jgi:hypothetical protein
VVEQLGIPGGDVAGCALTEPQPAEDPEGGGETLFPVPALLLYVIELGKDVGKAV